MLKNPIVKYLLGIYSVLYLVYIHPYLNCNFFILIEIKCEYRYIGMIFLAHIFLCL